MLVGRVGPEPVGRPAEQAQSLSQSRRIYESTNQALHFRIKDDYLMATTSNRLMKLYGQTVIPANGYYFMPVGKMATLYVDRALPAYNLKLGATLEWAGSTPEIVDGSTTYHALKSYAVVNAYGEWSPQGYDNLTVRLGVDNLFDETYVERSSYVSSTTADSIYGPGRTVTLGVSMEF